MDFSTFQITGPSTATDTVGLQTGGVFTGAGKASAIATKCMWVYKPNQKSVIKY